MCTKITPFTVDLLFNSYLLCLSFPIKPGDHSLYVFFADSPIKGSPFHLVSIPRVLPVDHEKVSVYGSGTKSGRVYRQSDFTVDGSLAGPGKNCHAKISCCVGPKVEKLGGGE